MMKRFNLWVWRIFVFALMIMVNPVTIGSGEASHLLDISIYSTGLKSGVTSEINTSDVTATMKDGLLDQGVRVQKGQGSKYDILSFQSNIDATKISALILSVYVNHIGRKGQEPSEGDTADAHVYAYSADGVSVQSSMVLKFALSHVWNALDLTQLLPLMNGFGFVKFRIVAPSTKTWFDISEASIILTGKGFEPWDLQEIFVSPPSLDFGLVEIGKSKSRSFFVYNIGTENLVIETVTRPYAPFSVTSDRCSGETVLPDNWYCSVVVEFAPASEGTFTDKLTIPSNDADHPEVTVNLSGITMLLSGTLTGTVTDSTRGLPISNVSVTVMDSLKTHTTTTDSNGTYTVSGVAQGDFISTFEKSGYIKQTVSDTLTAGQTLILNIQLTPIPPLTISITSPLDGAIVNSSQVTVTGSVSNNASVIVNGISASVSDDTFNVSIPVNEGQNTLTAIANDQYGQTASQSIIVTLITKGSINGIVTDSSTGLPISSATVSVTDSLYITQTSLTDINGKYTINGISSGAFSGSITKDGYTPYNFSGTMSPGQTIVINVTLNPILPTISNITVSDITTDSATITWSTDQLSDSTVEYGESASYGSVATNPMHTTTHSIILTGLIPSTNYHFKITSKNSYGFSSSSGDNTFITSAPPAQITITLTSPSEGATITRPDIMVTGTIHNNTGNETGVTVNGVVATVYGSQFMANVPLQEGSNTITATATDAADNTATISVTVNAVTSGNYIRLTSNIESGIAPLEVTMRIDGAFTIENSSINVNGPAPVEWLSQGIEEYEARMNAEGIYYFTASVTGPDAVVYQDTIGIVVLNRTQLDNLLKGKWEGMRTALTAQNVDAAANYFTQETKPLYADLFNAMQDSLPQISQEMQGIQILSVKGNTAKYCLTRSELYGGQTVNMTYYIYFVVDSDGAWKIYSY